MNTDYGDRPVTARELRDAFGSAEAALRATGGENRLALFYIHNPDRCASAPAVGAVETGLTDDLRAMRDSERQNAKNAERQRRLAERQDRQVADAAAAYKAGGNVSAVMRTCKHGRRLATALVAIARARGLLT